MYFIPEGESLQNLTWKYVEYGNPYNELNDIDLLE